MGRPLTCCVKTAKKVLMKPCLCRGVIYTQNIHRLSGKDKQLEYLLDSLVDIMISKEIMTYCVQETWLVGNMGIMMRGHMILLHNRCEREEGTKGRNPRSVTTISSLTAVVAWKEAGYNSPITTPFDPKFVGRFVGIKMSFPRFDKWGKIIRGFLKKFVASIYRPVDNKQHREFSEALISLKISLSKTVQFIGRHDVNAKLAVQKLMHKKVIGIYGIKNLNKKGRNLLGCFVQIT